MPVPHYRPGKPHKAPLFTAPSPGPHAGQPPTSTVHSVAAALNGPSFVDIQLHGRGSAYQRDLDRQGFVLASRNFSTHIINATLTESAGEAAVRLDVDLFDDARGGKASGLTPLTVGTELHLYGYGIDYFLGGGRTAVPHRLFRGQVYKADKATEGQSRTRSFTAYDPATYLARTEAPRVYIDKSFTFIFRDICKAFGFDTGFVAETKTPLGKIIMGPGWSLWRLFQECVRRHYDKTGLTFYVRSVPNKSRSLDLLNFGNWKGQGTGITWRITDGAYGSMTNHNISDSAEELATRIVMVQEEYDEEGEFKANKILRQGVVLGGLRETFGDLVKLVSPDSSLTPIYNESDPEWTKIDKTMAQQMKQMLANYGRTHQTATVRTLYIPGIRRGDRIVTGVAGDEMQDGWIIDQVSTEWSQAGASQTIDLVKHQSDSSVGVGG